MQGGWQVKTCPLGKGNACPALHMPGCLNRPLLLLACSYSDVAIYLNMVKATGAKMKAHRVRAVNGSLVWLPNASAYYAATLPVLDLLRAVTPLTWARWITDGGKRGKYGAVMAAMYGNNKEW